jgi:hypothetical protein
MAKRRTGNTLSKSLKIVKADFFAVGRGAKKQTKSSARWVKRKLR